MKNLDPKSADLLEFSELKELLADFATTAIGKEKALAINPFEDIEIVRRYLKETDEVQQLIDEGKEFPLTGLKDFRQSLEKACEQGRIMEPGDLLDVANTLQVAASVERYLDKLPPDHFGEIRRLSLRLEGLPELVEEITQAISSQEEVADEASQKLRRIRKDMRAIENKINRIVENLLKNPKICKALQSERATLRGDRLCLPVKAGHRKTLRGMLLDSSQTGQTLFIEPEQCVALGNRLADLRRSERNEINRILRRLTNRVVENKKKIRRSLDALAWLDFTGAKAKMAIKYEMHTPSISETGPLKLVDARHPLLLALVEREVESKEELWERVVPFDMTLGDEHDTLVITGPNTGGKTVALKAVGLLALMGQSGLPIPTATGCTLPVYDSVFASIGDEQSIASSLSTFSANIRRVIQILDGATSQSLVLIDEFGDGTDPDEAAVLGEAILDQLEPRGCHTIITTHISSLKKYAFKHERAANASVEFDSETLQPTYHLVVGMPGNSKALLIARNLGMDEEVVQRAEALLGQSEDRDWIDRLQDSVMKAEKDQRRIKSLRREIEGEKEKVIEEKKKIRHRRKILEQEVELELENFRRNLYLKMEEKLKPFQNAPREKKEKIRELKEFFDQALPDTKLGEKREAYAQGLKKGKKTFVVSMGKSGTITRINKSRREVKVKIGGLEVETDFDDLSWLGNVDVVEELSLSSADEKVST